MKRVFVMNTKGGCGKSTISNELAFSLDRTGTPYSYFDLDTQGGSAHKEALSDDAVVQVADTPARPTDDELARYARTADVVVIPVRSSSMDSQAFSHTLRTVRKNNPSASVIIVQNGWNRFTAAKEFGEWLEKKAEQSNATVFPLSQSDMIVQAQAKEASVVDWAPKARVSSQVLAIVNAVRSAAGIEPETYNSKV